jgi:nitrate reductase NapD
MVHIASAVVQARPADQDAVVASIAAFPGTEIMAAGQGRIIVVLEAGCHHDIGETLHRIADLAGVLSATLVFEHSEPEEDVA